MNKRNYFRYALAIISFFCFSTIAEAVTVTFKVKCANGDVFTGSVNVSKEEAKKLTKYSKVILDKASNLCGCDELCNLTVYDLQTTQDYFDHP